MISPLLARLDHAVSQLTSLQAEMAAMGIRVSAETLHAAHTAMLEVEDALPQGEAEEIALTFDATSPLEIGARMTEHLDSLRRTATEMREGRRDLYSERDAAALRRIVGETPPMLPGLFANRELSRPPRIPEWARELKFRHVDVDGQFPETDQHEYPVYLRSDGTAVVGSNRERGATSELKFNRVAPVHFEIRFTSNGRYWIRNLQTEILTSLNGWDMLLNDWLLLEDEAQLGFQLEEGEDPYVLAVKLPQPDPLERRRADIDVASSFERLIEILRKEKRPEIVDAVQVFADEGVGIGDVPETAGLARRARQLAAQRDFLRFEAGIRLFHDRYFGTLPLEMGMPHYRELTRTIGVAATGEDLLNALRRSLVPNMTPLILAVRRFLDGDGSAYAEIPNDFGLRAKVRELALKRLGIDSVAELEAFGLTVDEFFDRPWSRVRVGHALRLALARLKPKGTGSDFGAFRDLIDGDAAIVLPSVPVDDEEKARQALRHGVRFIDFLHDLGEKPNWNQIYQILAFFLTPK